MKRMMKKMLKEMKRSRQKTNKSNAGFSLLEIILATAILAIVSIPLMGYFTDAVRNSAMEAGRQQAMLLAQEITEGLMAENRLVTYDYDPSGVIKYKIPLFEETDYGFRPITDSESLMTSGTGQAVFETEAYNGYKVRVSIKNIGNAAVNEVKDDLLDYGISSRRDFVYADTTEYSQAVFGLKALYDNDHIGDANDDTGFDVSDIRENMTRDMKVELRKTAEGYQVRIYNTYMCSGISGEAAHSWPTDPNGLLVMGKTIEELQNIYLYYDWCDKEDTIILDVDTDVQTDFSSRELGLNIIYRQREGIGSLETDKVPGDDYTLHVKYASPGYMVNGLSVYTNVSEYPAAGKLEVVNLSGGHLKQDISEPTLAFDICTEVYSARGWANENRLAVIKMTKGE